MRAVTSSRLLLKIATSPSRTCICTRTPSSFHSAPAVPRRSIAVAASGALPASIGASGRPTSMRNASSAGVPPASAAAPTVGRSPASRSARRTAAGGTSAAFATASMSTPPSAPWRRSPVRSARRNRCSPAVARPKSSPARRSRSPLDPGPDSASSAASASIDVDQRQRRLTRRRRRVTESPVADARSALARLARRKASPIGASEGSSRTRHAARGRACRAGTTSPRRCPMSREVGQQHGAYSPSSSTTDDLVRRDVDIEALAERAHARSSAGTTRSRRHRAPDRS